MPAYILKGESKEVDKILRENRIRISRGVISITPAEPETALETKTIGDLELADITGRVVSIALEGGEPIPEDLTESLAKYGIIVPKISETTENTAEIGENLTESVPNTPENANIDSEPAAMDNKHIEVEDMQEVDLDADDKTPVNDDTKDVSEDDAKEAAPAKKTSKRSKKSE